MTGREFQGFLSTKPFVPLRVHASDGKTYDLEHPEQAYVMSTCVAIPLTEHNEIPERVEDRYRFEFLSTLQILESNNYSRLRRTAPPRGARGRR